jgi:hypothetical protein
VVVSYEEFVSLSVFQLVSLRGSLPFEPINRYTGILIDSFIGNALGAEATTTKYERVCQYFS